MDAALCEARAAAGRGEVPVGAVVVSPEGVVLAQAGNRVMQDRAALGSERLTGCALYVTLEPCAMCASLISQARIARLYYGASDPKSGGVGQGARVFEQTQSHHKPEVYDGICEAEAAAMLRDFFAARRGN